MVAVLTGQQSTDLLPRYVYQRIRYDLLIDAIIMQTVDAILETSLQINALVSQYTFVHPRVHPIYEHILYQLSLAFRLKAFIAYFGQQTGFRLPPNAYYKPQLAAKELSYHLFNLAQNRFHDFQKNDLILWSFQSDNDLTLTANKVRQRCLLRVIIKLDVFHRDIARVISTLLKFKPTDFDHDYIYNQQWQSMEYDADDEIPPEESLVSKMVTIYIPVEISYEDFFIDPELAPTETIIDTMTNEMLIPLYSAPLPTIISQISSPPTILDDISDETMVLSREQHMSLPQHHVKQPLKLVRPRLTITYARLTADDHRANVILPQFDTTMISQNNPYTPNSLNM